MIISHQYLGILVLICILCKIKPQDTAEMSDPIDNQSKALISNKFELELNEDPIQEEELLSILAEKVELMLNRRLDFLLSLLYRLDVEEHKINLALSPLSIEPPHIALAKLILERQKQRIQTKKKYSSTDNWSWDVD